MDSNNAVELDDIKKTFHIDKSTTGGFKLRNVSDKVILNGLTLNIKKGESLGVVGRNGSGKSTTLKIISKIIRPDSGRVEIDGKVASILELGMGFNPDFTGRENVYLKSSMFGFSEKKTSKIIDRIIDFSGLEEQIDDPVRTYSSGMNARLAFAIAINVECDIIVLDEILSIGDAGFRGKCASVFRQMKKEGKTLVIASHSMGTIESMCDRAVWIDNGIVREAGDPHTVGVHFEKDLTDSLDTVSSLSNSGDIVAMNKLGEMYRDGYNVVKNEELAEQWFSKAANLGNVAAMINYGRILEAKGDVDGALKAYTMAAETGDHDAQISILNLSGKIDSTFDDVAKRLGELADEGNTRAMFHFANALMKGVGIPQDQVQAHHWFHRAAALDDVESIFQVGIDYRDGFGVQKDSDEAERWLIIAAERGLLKAKVELANMFHKGITVDVDMKKAIYWMSEAAYAGDTSSMIRLGTIYRDGHGVNKDPAKADMWFSMYALQGRIRLSSTLAQILRQWNRSDEECIESMKWNKLASENGFAQSSYVMGLIYRDGTIIQPDSTAALSMFERAAVQNNMNGAYEAGLMHLQGNGTVQNPEAAFELIEKAAKSGNTLARYLLGTMYRDGFGTIRNLDAARHWFELASENGHTGAKMAYDKLRT